MLLNGSFPPDDRVKKEALSLIKEGFEVHLLCLNYGTQSAFEIIEKIQVHRIKINKTLWNKLFAVYLIFPLLYFIIKKPLEKLIKEHQFTHLHIHDLPLTNLGVKMKQKYGLKLIADQHEYFSNWIVNTASYNSFLGRIIKTFSHWKKYEQRVLKKADLVITIEEPLRECYIKEANLDPGKVILVPNTPLKQIFSIDNINPEIINRYQDKFVLLYIGALDKLRGLDTILDAVNLLKNHIPNLLFLVAGNEIKGYNLTQRIKDLNIKKQVDFIGWVDIKAVPSYIKASNICLFTPLTHWEEINKTIATKIYQYLAMGKPVIVSQAKLMQEFIEKNEVGFAIENPKDLSEKIRKLHTNKNMYNKISKRATEIMEGFYWEETIKPFIHQYKTL